MNTLTADDIRDIFVMLELKDIDDEEAISLILEAAKDAGARVKT